MSGPGGSGSQKVNVEKAKKKLFGKKSASQPITAPKAIKVAKPSGKTASELAAERARQKIQEAKLKEKAKKSHKDRICEYNEYLSKLSEHHDIPKDGVPGRRMKHQPIVISGARVNGPPDSSSSFKMETFVAYEIQSEKGLARRRYSEFELLHIHLRSAHPFVIVPPIPEKENISLTSIKSYVGLKKAEGKSQRTIQHRIRLLQIFLAYLEEHPILSKDDVFLEFLTDNASWSNIVIHEGLSNNRPSLPSGRDSSSIDLDDPKYSALIEKISGVQAALHSMERTQNKILRSLKDSAKAYGEMGQILNAFSLQYPALQEPLEESGVASDQTSSDLQDVIGCQEVLVETLNYGDDFCKAAKRTVIYHAKTKAEGEPESSIDAECDWMMNSIGSILERALKDVMDSNLQQSQNAAEVWKTTQAP